MVFVQNFAKNIYFYLRGFKALQWFAAVLCLGARAMAGKYSREVNEPRPGGADDEQAPVEFRIAKLNQVWEKAKRVNLETPTHFRGVFLDCGRRPQKTHVESPHRKDQVRI
uniref:Alpha-2-macroglobulin receptor-associated protein domain-containing protein n=1 Tax=Oryzias sinensis TaxID=183150 RepID=A0A8C7WSC1_9TELE